MRVFLSIGAGPGIGLATAERFASAGFRVVLAARSPAKLEELADQLKAGGHEAETSAADASDPDAVRGLISDVQGRHGAIDVVHYNAASLRRATIAEQPAETFATDLAVNIAGAMVAIQAASGAMIERGEGAILLTGGGFAFAPSPDFISLSIGKAGLRTLALGLFEPFKARGVHVGIVNVAANVDPTSRTPAEVAKAFWDLYSADRAHWLPETTYTP